MLEVVTSMSKKITINDFYNKIALILKFCNILDQKKDQIHLRKSLKFFYKSWRPWLL